MLGEASNSWVALTVIADATEVASSRISEEDVRAQIDRLSRSHETSASTRQFVQIHCAIDLYEDIDVFGDRFGSCQGTQKRDALHTSAGLRSQHEGQCGEKQRTTRFGN